MNLLQNFHLAVNAQACIM